MRPGRNKAFTLLECVIGLTLSVVILTALFMFLRLYLNTRSRTDVHMVSESYLHDRTLKFSNGTLYGDIFVNRSSDGVYNGALAQLSTEIQDTQGRGGLQVPSTIAGYPVKSFSDTISYSADGQIAWVESKMALEPAAGADVNVTVKGWRFR